MTWKKIVIFLFLTMTALGQVNYDPPTRKNILARRINLVRYANEQAGSSAGAKIANAITDLPSTGGIVDASGLEANQTISVDLFNNITKPITLKLGAGNYTISTTQTIETNQISIEGLGPFATTITCSANADCIRWTSNPWTTDQAGSISNLTIVGNSGANAVGIHMSGIIGASIRNVVIADFNGTNGTGLWLDHGASFSDMSGGSAGNFIERAQLIGVHMDWNTIGLKMTAQAAANSNGFAFMHVIDSRFNVDAGQKGILLDGTNGAGVIQTDFMATINCINGGTMIHTTNNGVWYDSNRYFIVGETTSGAACVGADIDSGSTMIGIGVLDIVNGGTTAAIDGTLTIRASRNQPGSGYGKNFVEQTETFAVRTPQGLGAYGFYAHGDLGAAGGFRQGIGQNLYFDGTNFIALGNTVTNIGAGLMFDGTNYCFYVSPTTGGTNNTISSATWTTYQRMCISSSGVQFGSVAAGGTKLTNVFSASGTVAFGNVVANDCTAEFSFALNGAVSTDSYHISAVGSLADDITLHVRGNSDSAPAVKACNPTTSLINAGTPTVRVTAWRF